LVSLYYGNETNFNRNGITTLDDVLIDASIKEELNGDYSLEMTINIEESKKKYGVILADDDLYCDDDLVVDEEREVEVAAKHDFIEIGMIINANGQLFRIAEVRKSFNSLYVYARHIFYDLMENFLEDVRPTETTGAGAINHILSNTLIPHNFIGMSDISNISTAYYVRKNPVEALIGTEDNSFINRWGGEIERDNFTIKMLNQRGNNNGVLVEYKKNLTGFEADILWDGLITKIMPVGKEGLLLPEKYIDSPLITYYPLVKVAPIEFSDCETVEDLRAAASTYFQDTLCDVPKVNYSIDMVELSSTEEYKDYQIFERVDVGDTVIVRHKDLNINITARAISVIKTATWVNGELTWVTSNIELGNFKENSATQTMNTINQLAKVIETNKSDLAVAIERATDLITGTFGGNLVINRTPDGQPYELLIMDTDDINTAKDVWRFNQGGLGHSSNGYNGPYETAITQDGQIVANFITTGILNADLLRAGSITSKNGRISLNLEDDTFTIYDAGGNKSIEFDDTNQHFYDWDNDHKVGSIYAARRDDDPNRKGLVLSCELGDYTAIAYKDTDGILRSFVDFDNGALGLEVPIKFYKDTLTSGYHREKLGNEYYTPVCYWQWFTVTLKSGLETRLNLADTFQYCSNKTFQVSIIEVSRNLFYALGDFWIDAYLENNQLVLKGQAKHSTMNEDGSVTWHTDGYINVRVLVLGSR